MRSVKGCVCALVSEKLKAHFSNFSAFLWSIECCAQTGATYWCGCLHIHLVDARL